MCSADIFLALLAILFPPLPVWVKCGICSLDSLLNILLCLLGFIPGLLHAWYIIAKFPEPPYEYESAPQEGARVTYVYVQPPLLPNRQRGGMNYGTNNNESRGHHQPQQAGTSSNAQDGVPPSYADVVAGDHKVQSQG